MKISIGTFIFVAVTHLKSAQALCNKNGNNLERCFYKSFEGGSSFCSSFVAAPTPVVGGFDCVTSKNGGLYPSSKISSMCSCFGVSTTKPALATTTLISSAAVPTTISSTAQASCPNTISVSVVTTYITAMASVSVSVLTVTESASASIITITESYSSTCPAAIPSASTITITESCSSSSSLSLFSSSSATSSSTIATSSTPPAPPAGPKPATVLVYTLPDSTCIPPSGGISSVLLTEGVCVPVTSNSFLIGAFTPGTQCLDGMGDGQASDCSIHKFSGSSCNGGYMGYLQAGADNICRNTTGVHSVYMACLCEE